MQRQPIVALTQLMRELVGIIHPPQEQIYTPAQQEEQAIACVQSWQKGSRVAHAYDYFRHRAQKVIWAQIIWKPFLPPKSSFVLWLGLRGRLLTRDRLDFLHIDQTCGFCGLEIETVRHLFFTCPMSRAIWQPVRAWTRMRREMNTLEAAVKWLRKEASPRKCLVFF